MRTRRAYGYGRVLLAILAGFVGEACSDDSGKSPVDGGADGPGGGMDVGGMDAPLPDAPVVDLAPADTRPADAPTPDAPAKMDMAVDRGVPDVPQIDATAVDGGGLVARGKYLVDHVIACSDCHTPKLPSGEPDMTKYLAGNPTFVELPSGDTLPSRNLTPDPTTGLGGFTADQIKHMFMDGVVPTSSGTMALNPVMPYYVFHNMTPADGDAIVAYLQSIPAVSNTIPDRSAAFDVSAPADYLDPATIFTPAASYPQRDSALRGRYLAAESGLCIECHTPHLASGPKPIDTGKYFQGGEDFSSFFAGTLNIHPVSANLTSDPNTGLGLWSADQIVNVLLQGVDDEGHGICPPMPVGPNGAFGGLHPEDALDIATYIKSLPPAVHDVADMCSWPPAPPLDAGAMDTMSIDVPSSSDVSVSGG